MKDHIVGRLTRSQVVIIIIKISYLVKISLQCQVPSLVVEKMANHLQRFDDCYDDDGDIYIMMKFLSVCCLCVTKNHYFLLGVSCNHP